MSFATKAKAEAGEAGRGAAEVGKMSLINKIRGQNPQKTCVEGGISVREPDYREPKRSWYDSNIRNRGLGKPQKTVLKSSVP
jgi:hypothetical protein